MYIEPDKLEHLRLGMLNKTKGNKIHALIDMQLYLEKKNAEKKDWRMEQEIAALKWAINSLCILYKIKPKEDLKLLKRLKKKGLLPE